MGLRNQYVSLSSFLVVGCPLEDGRDQWSSYPNVGYAVRGLYPSKTVVFMKLELAILLPQLHFGKGQTRMHSSNLVLCAVPLQTSHRGILLQREMINY